MRGIFGLIGLLAALVVAGVLVRQQLKAAHAPVPALQVPITGGDAAQSGTDSSAMPTSGTPAQPSQQMQQQFKQALDNAMQPRPLPADDQP